MLRMLQQLEISRRGGFETGVVGGCESFERMAGAIWTEILGDGALNLLHRHAGTPTAERWGHRRQRIGHEQVRLQSFDRGRLARQRQHHIGQQVQ